MIKLKKTIGTLFLVSWLPFVLALSFPESQDGWYTITGLMWIVFGTWSAILNLQDK